MIVEVRPDSLQIALPERFEDQPVSRLRAFDKLGNVEARVGSEDRANSGPRRRNEGHVARIDRRRRRGRGLAHPRSDACVGIGRLQYGLLLVAGSLTEHAVEAQPDKEGDKCEDDDDGQS